MVVQKTLNESRRVFAAFIVCSFMPGWVFAQSLNDVVIEQLSNSCRELLGNDNFETVLTGPLQEVCGPPIVGGPIGGAPGASGGGASVPAGLPNVLKRRLKEEKSEDDDQNRGGASADYVVELSRSIQFFFSGEYQSLDREVTSFVDGYDSNMGRVTAGADYRIHKTLLAGAAFDYRHQKGDFSAGGDFTLDSYGALVYANITPVDEWFVQVIGSYAYQNNDRSRFARFTRKDGPEFTGFVDSEYQGDEYSASIQSGYDFSFRNLTVTPLVGLDWIRNDYENFAETGNTGLEMRIDKDHRVSLQSRVGFLASLAFSQEFAVLVPQVGVSWLHEFKNDQRDIRFSFVGDTRNKVLTFQNDKPDRDFLEINAGLSAVFAHGVQAFINYRTIAGHSYFNSHSASVGVRVEF